MRSGTLSNVVRRLPEGRVTSPPTLRQAPCMIATKNWPKQPVSRVLFPQPVTRRRAMVIHLGAPLPTPSSNQPGSTDGPSLTLPYLVLLLVGFTWHPTSPPNPVSSYLTLSPLPAFSAFAEATADSAATPKLRRQSFGRRSSLCGTFPGVTPAGRYPAPYPVEPGLSSPRKGGGHLVCFGQTVKP
jgi:hypothetical protein